MLVLQDSHVLWCCRLRDGAHSVMTMPGLRVSGPPTIPSPFPPSAVLHRFATLYEDQLSVFLLLCASVSHWRQAAVIQTLDGPYWVEGLSKQRGPVGTKVGV